MNARIAPTNSAKRDSGNVLILTMMVMLLVTILCIGVLTVTSNTMFMTARQRVASEAFNLAESGAEMGALALRLMSSAPSGLTPFDPLGGDQSLGDGTYSVTVYPDPGNVASYLKTYRVISTGTIGSQTRKVEIIVRQATFGRFAYFTDKETSSVSGGAIWWRAGDICDGPAHSNNTSGSNFNINYVGSTAPIFRDILTASGTSISYNPSRPTDEPTFRKVYLDGSKGYRLGVPRVDLPASTNAQQNAAWGSEVGQPSTTGVYLRSDSQGGIYVVGDAAMQLGADGSGNQTIAITQGSNVTTITANLAGNTTTSTGPVGTGSPASCSSAPNGVIYCTGNITSLKGTVADNLYGGGKITTRSAWTIATDVNNNKDITITDNVRYNTRPNKTLSYDDPVNLAAATLGLVARNVKIASSAPTSLEINAVCLAGGQNTTAGSFYVTNYDTKQPTGTLTVLGGIIQKNRGPVGTFNSSTGQMTTGYAKNYSYDPRLASDPPPFYPTTGTYERLSWRTLTQ
ncbi:MAG: hypothetical protein NTU88_12650 [Armatimonadetes bacterium]|nr:hypothetical protein [Armatimonadota bacterium]